MNKRDLAYIVAYETGVTRARAAAAVDSVFKAITDALRDGARVQITGFGTFNVRERAAREGRNPRTGEAVTIPASRSPAFKASRSLKETVNSGQDQGAS